MDTEEHFAELIKAQGRIVSDAQVAPLERVGARVVRVGGFGNHGVGASGHSVATDEPVEFGGGGGAVDPAELLLIAVGASLSVTLTVHAALQDVTLADVSIALRGVLDAGRFFKPSAAPGGGFFDLVIDITIDSPAPRATIDALIATALQASPVLCSIAAEPEVRLILKDLAA